MEQLVITLKMEARGTELESTPGCVLFMTELGLEVPDGSQIWLHPDQLNRPSSRGTQVTVFLSKQGIKPGGNRDY